MELDFLDFYSILGTVMHIILQSNLCTIHEINISFIRINFHSNLIG